MALVDELIREFHNRDPYTFQVRKFVADCKGRLDTAYDVSGQYDPRDEKLDKKRCSDYAKIVFECFLPSGLNFAAKELLKGAWDRFAKIQQQTNHRIYRAGLAAYLANLYTQLGNDEVAFRWVLHAHADDMLGGFFDGGGGYEILGTRFGLDDNHFARLKEIGESSLQIIKGTKKDEWRQPSAFAEDIVRQFLEMPDTSFGFSGESKSEDFPLCSAYFHSLLEKINDSSSEGTAKGDALEALASYLFFLVPGWVPLRNIMNEDLAFENDIVLRNVHRANSLEVDLFGRYFLVECKNWEVKVSVSQVGYFLYRMHLTHATFGVLFAQKGITGTQEEEKAAYSLIRKAFHEDHMICVVIDEIDLGKLEEEKISFKSMLIEKLERVRFGAPRTQNKT